MNNVEPVSYMSEHAMDAGAQISSRISWYPVRGLRRFNATRALRSLALDGGAPKSWATSNQHSAPPTAVRITISAVSLTILLNYLLSQQVFGLLLHMTAMVLTVSWLLIVVAHLKFRRTRSKLNSLMFPVPWTAWSNYLIIVFVIAILAILAADHTLRSALILTGFSFTGLFITATLRVRRLFDEVHC